MKNSINYQQYQSIKKPPTNPLVADTNTTAHFIKIQIELMIISILQLPSQNSHQPKQASMLSFQIKKPWNQHTLPNLTFHTFPRMQENPTFFQHLYMVPFYHFDNYVTTDALHILTNRNYIYYTAEELSCKASVIIHTYGQLITTSRQLTP